MLLFSPYQPLTIAAVIVMVGFHLFVVSTFPIAVPLEWNVLFAYATIFLFLGFPAWDGYGIADMSSPWLTFAIVAALLFFPILGNLRPDLVSFLPAMRQYAGNWSSALWAFAPGAEDKLNRVTRPTINPVDQLVAFGYEPTWAEIFTQYGAAIRSLHSPCRGLFSLLHRHLPDIDTRTVREAEIVCTSLIASAFGDGHLHNEDMVGAVQSQRLHRTASPKGLRNGPIRSGAGRVVRPRVRPVGHRPVACPAGVGHKSAQQDLTGAR